MLKKFSRLSLFLFALLLVPFGAVFADEAAEAASTTAASNDMLYYSLLFLSIVTLILLAFLSVKDNG